MLVAALLSVLPSICMAAPAMDNAEVSIPYYLCIYVILHTSS